MTTTIEKWFTFDAAHWLPSVPEGHQCRRVHGHTFSLVLGIEGSVRNGMVIEYGVLADLVLPFVKFGAARPGTMCVDHCTLNDVPGLENPTTEVLAEWFHNELAPLIAAHAVTLVYVRVHESSTTNATYRP